MDVQAEGNWADRLGSTRRYTLIVIISILGIFTIGMLAGFSYAIYEDGELPTKPFAYIAFAAILGLAALVGWVLTTLIRSLRNHAMSGFDRRYWTMWAVIVGLSIPIGIGVAMLGLNEELNGLSLFSNSPIAPLTAVVGSVLLGILLIASVIIYFRAIDDHEERAYLWGSTVAFHFLVLVFPLHWLLARGGLVPALTIGSALLLVLISCILQAIVWALFKFR